MSNPTHDSGLKLIASIGLGLGSALGMAGSFVPSEKWRGLAWGIDGVSLVIAGALLAVHFYRRGEDLVAAGYLVFVVGQGLVLSTAAMSLSAATPLFGAGASLWAAALVLIGAGRVYPLIVRLLRFVAAAMFAVTSAQIFYGVALHAKSEPLPSFAYPIFVAAMIGWIVTLLRSRAPAASGKA
jgi:hypothetical protein